MPRKIKNDIQNDINGEYVEKISAYIERNKNKYVKLRNKLSEMLEKAEVSFIIS